MHGLRGAGRRAGRPQREGQLPGARQAVRQGDPEGRRRGRGRRRRRAGRRAAGERAGDGPGRRRGRRGDRRGGAAHRDPARRLGGGHRRRRDGGARPEITPELRRAGLAREVVRLVQEARKTSGLQVTDRVDAAVGGGRRAGRGAAGARRRWSRRGAGHHLRGRRSGATAARARPMRTSACASPSPGRPSDPVKGSVTAGSAMAVCTLQTWRYRVHPIGLVKDRAPATDTGLDGWNSRRGIPASAAPATRASEVAVTLHVVPLGGPAVNGLRLKDGVVAVPALASHVRPSLVLAERETRELLAAAPGRTSGSAARFSAGPAGIQVWDGPFNGPTAPTAPRCTSGRWTGATTPPPSTT